MASPGPCCTTSTSMRPFAILTSRNFTRSPIGAVDRLLTPVLLFKPWKGESPFQVRAVLFLEPEVRLEPLDLRSEKRVWPYQWPTVP